MPELEYDEFLDLMSHQQSWIEVEFGENLSCQLAIYYYEEFCESN